MIDYIEIFSYLLKKWELEKKSVLYNKNERSKEINIINIKDGLIVALQRIDSVLFKKDFVVTYTKLSLRAKDAF